MEEQRLGEYVLYHEDNPKQVLAFHPKHLSEAQRLYLVNTLNGIKKYKWPSKI
jgi:hypothetical protein